ncbi:RNA polymerase sigma factor [Ornithinimicrobium pekingense]|uniref:RNA polymerase sigma factor n=1 Tax=Ornithinimicrobium pekingense TaxID=384677 RepID=A0ABQ2F2Q0_9MICO|nr:sigma-70 family RNA polymerase sigma factor [Ornithinimicrobium pekingense]GGK56285.1 RNA polymerase sigma factor [Ornithinimicrobium pekingense]
MTTFVASAPAPPARRDAGRQLDSVAMSSAAQEEQLASAWAGGDESVVQHAYERWGGLVHGLARRAVGPADADDVTQQVFLAAWRRRETYRHEEGPLGAWLVGITRRQIAEHLRTRHRAAEVPTAAEELPGAASPAWSAADADDLLAIYEELERIGEPQRQIVLMAYVQDKTQREIAEELDLPLGTVKTHTTRTMARLRTLVGGAR